VLALITPHAPQAAIQRRLFESIGKAFNAVVDFGKKVV